MNMKKYVVMKFGGTSVSKKERWDVIHHMGEKRLAEGLTPIIVCSAMSGVSDILEGISQKAMSGHYQADLEKIKNTHLKLIDEMNSPLKLDQEKILQGVLNELDKHLQGIHLIQEITPRLKAKIMSWGELLSTHLGALYLKGKNLKVRWYDAREILQVDEEQMSQASLWRQYLNGQCAFEPDDKLMDHFDETLESETIILTQGFIAANKKGETVLLGRGGSDTSASYMAAKIQAVRCEIWTDVPGMFTANPKMIKEALLLKKLHYREAQEMASTGAKVLHPRCIYPVQKYEIPLLICSTEQPELEGTLIKSVENELSLGVKSISLKKGVHLISLENQEMWKQSGFLADIFNYCKKHDVSIDLLSTSESNVTFSLDSFNINLPEDAEKVRRLLVELNQLGEAKFIGPCSSIGLVGQKIRSILSKLAPLFKVFQDQKVYMLSQSASDLNLTFVVDEKGGDEIVIKLHYLLFHDAEEKDYFGKSWEHLFDNERLKNLNKDHHHKDEIWWEKKKDELLILSKNNSPLYIYDEETILRQCQELKKLTHVDRLFYALKANHHPDILSTIMQQGLGLECVSQGELEYLFQHFPQLQGNQVLFTPNFGHRSEYEWALEKGVYVTIDGLYPLEHWPEIFRNKEIILRIDPGQGRGHHHYVHTGGMQSKFGISLCSPSTHSSTASLPLSTATKSLELEKLKKIIKKENIKVIGLHTHAGSGIEMITHWKEMGLFLLNFVKDFPEVKFFNLGGGLAIPYLPHQRSMDMSELNRTLAEVKEKAPGIKLWMEPGRFLVGEAGILLTKVNQIKKKEGKTFIGVDTGMNSLIRPALYNAFHNIVNLSRLDDAHTIKVQVVGPICESGDTLGFGRQFPLTYEGDTILVEGAGAYGAVMSSQYNLRTPAQEIFLKKKNKS